jgi:hypothetical protein
MIKGSSIFPYWQSGLQSKLFFKSVHCRSQARNARILLFVSHNAMNGLDSKKTVARLGVGGEGEENS